MITFNDFINEHNLETEATSNIKIFEVLNKIGLDSNVGTYLRDGDLSTLCGIVNLPPSRRSHCVCFIKGCYFDSYGCPPPKKLFNHLKNRYKKCIYSEYQIQKMIVFVLVIFYT